MAKMNELLAQLDDAFEATETCSQAAAEARIAQEAAVSAKKTEYDQLCAEHAGYVSAADQRLTDARTVLAKLRDQVSERVNGMTDARVTIR